MLGSLATRFHPMFDIEVVLKAQASLAVKRGPSGFCSLCCMSSVMQRWMKLKIVKIVKMRAKMKRYTDEGS